MNIRGFNSTFINRISNSSTTIVNTDSNSNSSSELNTSLDNEENSSSEMSNSNIYSDTIFVNRDSGSSSSSSEMTPELQFPTTDVARGTDWNSIEIPQYIKKLVIPNKIKVSYGDIIYEYNVEENGRFDSSPCEEVIIPYGITTVRLLWKLRTIKKYCYS